jgi:hypothetical protein
VPVMNVEAGYDALSQHGGVPGSFSQKFVARRRSL